MEYPLLNYTSQSCPSDHTPIEVSHALALPEESQQLPPASVVLVHRPWQKWPNSIGISLLVGDGVLQGGEVCPLSSRQIFCTPEGVKGCGDVSGSGASSAWWETTGKTDRDYSQELGVTGQGGMASNCQRAGFDRTLGRNS